MKVTRIYSRHEEEIDVRELDVGDTIRLPEFTVSETTIKGNKKLYFEEHTVKDTATVYNIKNGKVYLVFNHALFTSAMDLNNATEWKKTQLRAYLRRAFKNAMRDVGVPVSEVSLLSKDELFGEKALPFFKDGRNRIAFSDNESYSVWYWLKDASSAADFCVASLLGTAGYDTANCAYAFVRPCLIVNTKQQDN